MKHKMHVSEREAGSTEDAQTWRSAPRGQAKVRSRDAF